jgi:hypothetical protein
MTEQFIEFETAKLAKEKGFNKEQNNFYHSHGYLNKTINDFFVPRFEAPTQSLLQKWLREVHDIDLDIYRNVLTEKYRVNEVYVNCKEIALDTYTEETEYKTYEEALEAGLIVGLKQIKK